MLWRSDDAGATWVKHNMTHVHDDLREADATRPLLHRLALAVTLTAPLVVLAMVPPVQFAGWEWVGLALATPVVFWAGWPFFERAWASLINRSPNMFTLIALGVSAAFFFSAAGTLAPGLFPAALRPHGMVETYFDTAAVITVLVLLGLAQFVVSALRGTAGTDWGHAFNHGHSLFFTGFSYTGYIADPSVDTRNSFKTVVGVSLEFNPKLNGNVFYAWQYNDFVNFAPIDLSGFRTSAGIRLAF